MITVDEKPIWLMQYMGWYSEDAIVILKAALKDAYSRREFVGGRGPRRFMKDNWIYQNIVEFNDFRSFTGEETIGGVRNSSGFFAGGYHRYQGRLLLGDIPDLHPINLDESRKPAHLFTDNGLGPIR